MICPACNGKLEVVDVVRDSDDIYRRRKCKSCGQLIYTTESEVTPDTAFRAAWNACERNSRVKGDKR